MEVVGAGERSGIPPLVADLGALVISSAVMVSLGAYLFERVEAV